MEHTDSMKGKVGLELNVIDHYNGTERSVRTLSGGETFQASLSLALGHINSFLISNVVTVFLKL